MNFLKTISEYTTDRFMDDGGRVLEQMGAIRPKMPFQNGERTHERTLAHGAAIRTHAEE